MAFKSPRVLKRVSLELPEELVAAIDARKESMGCATRGEVLSGLMSWMLKDPLDDGDAE